MAACRTPRLYLAPMMNRTTTFFRSLVRILSPSPSTVLYTQMFAANAIIRMKEMDETSEGGSGGSSLLSSVLSSHIQFEPRQHPVVVQLGGSDAEQMAAAAKLCESQSKGCSGGGERKHQRRSVGQMQDRCG
mmetsp:Transcript_35345/g.91897  ORF Transcript_35345/g.91897 Transcript_35345/m.91897 type:complete len:132 (+) Transcript_35345:61-456(+)